MKPETTDKTIEQAVMRELEWDPAVSAAHIGVTAKDGAVVLTGHVNSYAERLAAVSAAERVYGVRAVADEVDVKPAAATTGSDEQIAETILRQLRANGRVPDSVKVEVRNGFVTLRGTVESSFQRDAAERLIEHLRGVYSVENLIAVKPRARLRASEIERRRA